MVGEGRRDCHVERKVRRGFLFFVGGKKGEGDTQHVCVAREGETQLKLCTLCLRVHT